MRDTAQTRLDAPDDERDALVGLAQTLHVHDDAAIRPPPPLASGRVRIVAPHAAIRGIAVHHGIHVAARDAEKQPRRAEAHEVARALPIGLRDDTHAKAAALEHAPD